MDQTPGGAARMRRALLATDGSPLADAATAFTGALAWPPHARISVACIVETPAPGDLAAGGLEEHAVASWREAQDHIHAAAREQALTYVAAAGEALRAGHPAVEVEEIVRYGEPAAELLSLAEAHEAEVIIAGARGRTVLDRLLLGSVSEALVTEALCPVLIVREPVGQIDTVVVALRTPADADRLARVCLRLPLPATASIIALTASAPRSGPDDRKTFAPGRLEALLASWDEAERVEAEAAGQRFVDQVRAGDPQRAVSARVIRGTVRPAAFESRADIAPALLEEATALGASLLVAGAREPRGLGGRLGLGSVSRKLVRRAPMATLVVRGESSA